MRLAFLLLASAISVSAAPRLKLRPDDHVALVGAGPIERLQFHGHLETLLHAAHPGHRLVIRNLGFAGDEVGLRPRSDGTPPLEFFLDMTPGVLRARWGSGEGEYRVGAPFHATVIVAQWGFNESFAGPSGLGSFRRQLDAWVVSQLAADRGRGRPRLALMSPPAMEEVPSLPGGHAAARNADLAAYSRVVAEVAAARGLPFVDLFSLSRDAFSASPTPLTLHGIHLTEAGEAALAPRVLEALLGRPAPARVSPSLRPLVREKGREWRARYRAVDQFNIYGQRSRIAYADHRDPAVSVTNARILNQEMAQRDVLTARLDAAVWEAASGGSPRPDRSGLPAVEPVPSNLPPRAPLPGAETLAHLRAADGCKVELAADEVSVPDLINPVQMAFDARGRLWVATWPNYPSRRPDSPAGDKLLVLDLDPATGKVVRSTVFLDGLDAPTGFQFHRDGVLVVQAPDLLLARDTDGDGRADAVEPVLHGIDSADTHHTANSLAREPGGAIYLSDGVFHRAAFETPWGPVRNTDGAVHRYEPLTGRVQRHAPYGFANPHGRVFDRWGNDLITDATGNHTYFGPAISGHLDQGKHPEFPQLWDRPYRPSPGTALLSSRHFPDDWQGLLLNLNVIGFQGIHRVRLLEDGAGLRGEALPQDLLWVDVARAPHFRPVAAAVAPDGSLYVIDWCQQLIGHLQHHLRDPNRDHSHGRIFRVTYPSRPLLAPRPVAGRPIPELLSLLAEPEDGVRERARIELEGRPRADVLRAARDFLAALDRASPGFEHLRLEVLWLHQALLAPDAGLLREVLASPDPRARAQAARVLGYWRDRLDDPLGLLAPLAADPHPRVRLEVARVASFFRDEDAARAARILLPMMRETERHLAYVVRQTALQLRRFPAAAAVLADGPAQPAPVADDAPDDLPPDARALFVLGREIYLREGHCATCHQKDGRGMAGAYPPLNARAWLEDDERLSKIVLHGLHGALRVRGETYGAGPSSPPMPGFAALLDDREVAAVLTYVRRSFGNRLPPVAPAAVAKVRAAHAGRTAFWKGEELAPGRPQGR